MPIELAFETQSLRTACEEEKAAVNKFGGTLASELRARIADLRAADSVADLVAGSPTFTGGDEPSMTVLVSDSLELVFRPNHVNNPHNATGALDWSRVRRLKLVRIKSLAGGS